MIVDDLLFIDTAAPIETDVCLVGSGPAGCAIAEELRDSGLRILVLESGGERREARAQALNAIESVGAPLLNGRERRLGGTSTVWAGRCIPLDDIDYEARPWVPLSGWPLGRETVVPHLDRAGAYLGAGPYDGTGQVPQLPGAPPRPRFDPSLLRHVCWEDTAPVDTGRRLLGDPNPHLRVLLNATVTHLNSDPETGQLESVEVVGAPDSRATVTAQAVVLCAGGVENARILLYSNRIRPAGLGNDQDLVGRYLIDHPRDPELLVRFQSAEAPRVRRLFGPRRLPSPRGRHDFTFGVALSPERQRREELLNCAAWPYWWFESSEDPMRAAKRLLIGPRTQVARDARLLLDRRADALRALWTRATDQPEWRAVERIGMLIASEQVPDRDSRVRLSERRDPLGLPISEIDWRIGAQERASQAALARLIAREFERLGLPAVQLADWVIDDRPHTATFVDGCHPTGTTRMAADPRHGVVDADCHVHGVPGLYVAGSSVFPTAGHANPTLMIVALAIRLAHHLRRSLAPRVEIGGRTGPDQESMPARGSTGPARGSTSGVAAGTTVAVTGATGFIGGRLVERLVDEGADVVCLTRSASSRSRRLPVGAAVRTVELSDGGALREALDGTRLVFHCAYDWEEEAWNLPALRALIEACRATGCRRLVHLSSFVVYRLPAEGEVTEDTAEIAADSGYAHTKLQLEGELFGAARDGGLPAAVLQPTLVYGPGSQAWTTNPADMLHYGTVVLPGAGEGVCNAVYVDDVVNAMILAATRPEAVGARFLISGPRPVTWSRFYEQVAAAIGADGPRYLPAEMIAWRDGRLGKLRELATDPNRLLRRLAQTGIGDRVLTIGLRALPQETAGAVRTRLHVRHTRLPGKVHLPDVDFMQSRAVVSSDKARRMIGYEPQFDFSAGMVPTARYLAEYAARDLAAVASQAGDR
ncbi:MAG TPA: GMC family oxidoreductase [Solirubrobacteraceae bacterium]|nr:GMC family oxidoreductase [Solirubrobacteraceae bacterium]